MHNLTSNPLRPRPAIAISAPYPEGAILAIARRAAQREILASLQMPSRGLSRALSRLLERLGRKSLAERLQRGAHDVPQLQEIAPFLEFGRLLFAATGSRKAAGWAMHHYKVRFDDLIAAATRPPGVFRGPELLVGMPGGCLRTFAVSPDARKIFHAVDAHPRSHNAALLEHYSVRHVRAELLPDWVVERIEQEIELSDYLLVPSKLVKHQMTQHGSESRKVINIPYGVDLDTFAPNGEAGISSISPSRRSVTILYVGQISYRKGLPILISAAAKTAANIVLIGPLVCPALIKHLPANVRYQGTGGRSEVISAMNNADAFVLPTVEDACALVVAEAAASGLPVITTPMNGAHEILDKRDLRLVAAGDESGLSDELNAVTPLREEDRKERASRVRAKGWNGTSGLYGWASYADRAIDALTDPFLVAQSRNLGT